MPMFLWSFEMLAGKRAAPPFLCGVVISRFDIAVSKSLLISCTSLWANLQNVLGPAQLQ
ncbi:unnamed protein product [Acanthoscelides obtectus]|uniref:Uncharacterized protein n=1 Tax=Acanthoscelides obtectus TaxID=200917 RepID=A0A9P0KW56_ACAOB|nr:unnamed protein product [Acanthoscelides obtectus]CAK1660670.1 hypothetical protein AOBTE_LOCUS22213 [Acanthoscelides obtectus]